MATGASLVAQARAGDVAAFARIVAAHHDDGDTQNVTIWEMTGEGGHEGLSLFLFDEPGDTASWGLVIASEAIPPYPDVPAP